MGRGNAKRKKFVSVGSRSLPVQKGPLYCDGVSVDGPFVVISLHRLCPDLAWTPPDSSDPSRHRTVDPLTGSRRL